MALLALLVAAVLAVPTVAYAESVQLYMNKPDADSGIKNVMALGSGSWNSGFWHRMDQDQTITVMAYMRDGYLFDGSWTVQYRDGRPYEGEVTDLREFRLTMPDDDLIVSAPSSSKPIGDVHASLNGSVLTWDGIDGYESRAVLIMGGMKDSIENSTTDNPHDTSTVRTVAETEFTEADQNGRHSADLGRALRISENEFLAILADENSTSRERWEAEQGLTRLEYTAHDAVVCYGKPDGNGGIQEQGRTYTTLSYTYETGHTKLDAPANLTWDEDFTATWDAVDKATGYEVTFYETAADGTSAEYGSVTVTDGSATSCALTDVQGKQPTEGATYAFAAKALYDDADYLPSEASARSAESGAWIDVVEYDVWIAGTRATNVNAADVLGDADEGATVTYDASTKTLTLDDANIAASDLEAAIYAKQDLTIELEGENTVTLTLTDAYAGARRVAAIACEGGSLSIGDGAGTGQGSLKATCDAEGVPTLVEEYRVSGISATGAISVEGVELTAESLVARDGYASSYGMRCRSFESVGVTLRDSTVTATSADTRGACSIAIECAGENAALAGRSVLVEGGELKATTGFSAYASAGIDATGDVIVERAKVTAAGGESGKSAGILSWIGDVSLNGDVTARGSRAKGTPEGAWSAGVRADKGSVSIAGGTVGATSGRMTDGGNAHGIFGANGVSITGGTVTASGPTTNMHGIESDHSAGIASGKGDVVISGAGTNVSAYGGYSGGDAFGIEAANGDVTITDATVRAAASYSGTDNATGIRAGGEAADAGNIVICGADVAAAGDARAVSFTGSLAVTPAEGMQTAVRTHDKVLEDDWSTPDPDWDGMAAASTAIEGSPFAGETTIDPALLEGARYLDVNDEQAEGPHTPATPQGPDAQKPAGDKTEIPNTGDTLATPLVLLALLFAGLTSIALSRR